MLQFARFPVDGNGVKALGGFVVTCPQLTDGATIDGMAECGSQLRQRPEHEGVGEDLAARQHQRCLADQLAVEQQIEIQGARGELLGIRLAAVSELHGAQPLAQAGGSSYRSEDSL